jgi:hypothetical protein
VPCSFKERLNKFSGNWLVAQSPRFCKFDMFLLKEKEKTEIYGPYWKSLVRVYGIRMGDVVHFQLDEDPFEPVDNLFNAVVYTNGAEKDVSVDTGMCYVHSI